MQVWWGPELTTFYNDACIPLVGDQHPTALGRHAPEIFSERWRTVRAEAERVRMDGIEVEVDGMHLVPLVDEHGGVEGILCALAELESEEPAREDACANDDFLSLIGHELRNPLSALSTTMQLFEMRGSSPEIDLMQRSVRHLTHLVDDLLDISRLCRGRLTLRRKHVELATVADRALEHVGPISDDRKVSVFVRVPRSGMVVDADGERLARALARVLTNAIEHSAPEASVRLEATPLGDRAHITITDHGAGIAASQLGRVFEAFRSGRASGGLGVGLAIARGIVELHGGVIALSSEGLGHGTECMLELPLAAKRELGEPRVPGESTVLRRLLLVEDNDDTARALANALKELGYEVAVAHDGPIALNLVRDFDPDVVLLDIGLPVMDGWELARRMRERTRELHIVAVTARDQDSDRQVSAEAGFVDHLVKPIDLGRLQQLVESLPSRARR